MKLNDIAYIRLKNQQIATTEFKSPKELVAWMGAIQAQDYANAKWAIGVRIPGIVDRDVETAIDNGEILRTHILRPTWHFITAEDIYWMLNLTAPRIKSSLKSRHKELELDETILKRSNQIITKALLSHQHLTREELMLQFEKAKIPTDNNRSSHFLLMAELDGLICSGVSKGSKQTYTLLETRVPKLKTFHKDEALAKLAERYFTSHGPATLQDFTWWSGLTTTDAKHALEMIKSNFICETIDSQNYWLSNSFSIPEKTENSTYLLPAFDEYTISYKDRSASVDLKNYKLTVSENGIFRPIIVVNGQVNGLWKRTVKKDKVIIDLNFFKSHSKTVLKSIEQSAKVYGDFLEKKVEINLI